MLKYAIQYKDQLAEKFIEFITSEKSYWWNVGNFIEFENILCENTWDKLQMISVSNDEVVGYIECGLDRCSNNAYHFSMINFTGKINPVFSKDMISFINKVLIELNFRKIRFSVVVGNPAEKIYDKFISRYGGRVVGFFKEDAILIDGVSHDVKHYEIMRTEYKGKILNG